MRVEERAQGKKWPALICDLIDHFWYRAEWKMIMQNDRCAEGSSVFNENTLVLWKHTNVSDLVPWLMEGRLGND